MGELVSVLESLTEAWMTQLHCWHVHPMRAASLEFSAQLDVSSAGLSLTSPAVIAIYIMLGISLVNLVSSRIFL